VMPLPVYFRFPPVFFKWFDHHTETLYTKRYVIAHRKPPTRKTDRGPVVLLVLILGAILFCRGVAKQKSLSTRKTSRILTKISLPAP
jgi:hypothetical protein